MRKSSRIALCALVVAPLWLACSDVTFEGGGPLSITLSADQTAPTAGGTVTFSYDAVGSILVGIILDYGDGTADSVAASGAQTAVGHLAHTYEAAGTFTAEATVLDNLQGSATAQVQIQVSPGAQPGSIP